MKILMCPPEYYDVIYQINPWMTRQHEVDQSIAKKQWQNLKETIENLGASVHLMPAQPQLPDMVFTANAALVLQNKAYLANFKHPERQDERQYFASQLTALGLEVIHQQAEESISNKNNTSALPEFEGAGDALSAGSLLFLGYGPRSGLEAHADIARHFTDYRCFSLNLINPYFYHLDTCFCPLKNNIALFYPGAFSKEGNNLLAKHLDCIAVPQDEAEKFACNAVALGGEHHYPCRLPNNCKPTKRKKAS